MANTWPIWTLFASTVLLLGTQMGIMMLNTFKLSRESSKQLLQSLIATVSSGFTHISQAIPICEFYFNPLIYPLKSLGNMLTNSTKSRTRPKSNDNASLRLKSF